MNDARSVAKWACKMLIWNRGDLRPQLGIEGVSAQVIAPQAIPLIAYPKAWSPGVNIPNGEVVYVDGQR